MIDNLILSHLVLSPEYGKRVFPFLKEEYFRETTDKIVFRLISHYTTKYNSFPSKESLTADLERVDGLAERSFKDSKLAISQMAVDKTTQIDWLIEETERFCKDRALYNALLESIKIIDSKGDSTALSVGVIPKLMTDALSVSFDSHIGHDFFEDIDRRFEFYNRVETRVPFDLDYLNRITNGGLPRKSLSCVMAATGGGKTQLLCHMAAANLTRGFNVLYITLEMSEEMIAKRIDANILDIPISQIQSLNISTFRGQLMASKKSTTGRLIIKEYPTTTAHSGHFRTLVNELRLKKNFSPDIIYVDYINICASSRVKMGNTVNSYSYVKAISEELRGLAVELNVPVMTATQVNRGGFASSDVSLSDTAESFGLPQTADLMFALISTPELEDLGQVMVKQLKNRYSDPNTHKRFVLGVDRAKMKFFDVDETAQTNLVEEPVMNNTKFGSEMNERETVKRKFKFTDFK